MVQSIQAMRQFRDGRYGEAISKYKKCMGFDLETKGFREIVEEFYDLPERVAVDQHAVWTLLYGAYIHEDGKFWETSIRSEKVNNTINVHGLHLSEGFYFLELFIWLVLKATQVNMQLYLAVLIVIDGIHHLFQWIYFALFFDVKIATFFITWHWLSVILGHLVVTAKDFGLLTNEEYRREIKIVTYCFKQEIFFCRKLYAVNNE